MTGLMMDVLFEQTAERARNWSRTHVPIELPSAWWIIPGMIVGIAFYACLIVWLVGLFL